METLPRAWPSLVAGATAVGIVLALAWRAGGYFPPSYLTAGAVAFGVLGLLLIVRPPHYEFSTHALLAFGALAALAVWTGLSSRWSSAPDAALAEMQRTLVYVGLFGLALIAAGSGRLAPHLMWAVLVAALVVVVAGLISRFYPDVLGTPAAAASDELSRYRLGYPLGYWNVYGALAAFGGVLALGLAADPRSAVVLRALAAGAVVLFATGMYLSLSRGAWLAMLVGLVALVALGAHRGSLLVTAAVVVPATVSAIVRLHSYPALVDDPSAGAGQLASGHRFVPQLLVLVALVVVVQAVIAAGRASENLMQALRRVFRPLVVGTLAIAALATVGLYAVKASAVEGRAANALQSGDRWVGRQWRDFLRPTTFSESGSARLTSSRGTRSDLYRVAVDGFEARPLIGDGAGAFEYRFMRTREVPEKVRNAHSLYLETLGGLGLVGAGLLLLFVGSLIAAAVRARMRPGGLARSQAAAAGAACAVWFAHSWVDWDWQMPAFTGAALILAATLYPYGRRSRRPARKQRGLQET